MKTEPSTGAGKGYRTTRLNRSEFDRVYSELNPDALRALYGGYGAAQMTDQPEENLLIFRGDKPTFISVYGSLKSPEVRAEIPVAIANVYDKLMTFNAPKSADWLPDMVEVMVSPYDYAPAASIKWPKDLPDLNDVRTVKRGDSFSIFVPSSKLQEVQSFLARRADQGAVEINGKKWTASIRFPFPAERLWLAPNHELKEKKN